ncbi:hypothetical protein BDN70DRAFT_890133 [Pholiota conissans]|uniref:Uncharacterized protein n=1 Tax=Pholiota conissans TaxID=109636 RepID=A0A9P5ZDP1_9AGAR|nr:hypothetical protein BDN70DRAFT_890133 [Pholiota conissans]
MNVAKKLIFIFQEHQLYVSLEAFDVDIEAFNEKHGCIGRSAQSLSLQYSEVFDLTQFLHPSKRLSIALSCGINHVLMSQFAKIRAKELGIPYKQPKLNLTSKEKKLVAASFREAKLHFDKTQNKPHKQGLFEATHGARSWTGYTVRVSIYWHLLARNAHHRGWLFKKTKRFRNIAYASSHPHYPGLLPAPHLLSIHPKTKKQFTKFTTEYPMVEAGHLGIPHPSSSSSSARTLISFFGLTIGFEGVVSHADDRKDRHNHYWAVYTSGRKKDDEDDDFDTYYQDEIDPKL